MKLAPPETLASIASIINAEYQGEEDFPITGINEINSVEEGDLVFVDHEKYYTKALNSAANTILINKKVDCPEGKALIFSDEPFDDFNRLPAPTWSHCLQSLRPLKYPLGQQRDSAFQFWCRVPPL